MSSHRRRAAERGAEGVPLRERGYRLAARTAARRALREDLAGYGDLTGSVFAGDGVARVVAREAGVLSGVAALEETARLVDPELAVDVRIRDGESFEAGAVVAELRGPLAAILATERTALNFLCRLSGVATLTARYVAETSGTKARVAATRKTTPGLRALEKQAVVHGGGTPHRFGLFDGAMIKDNHVAAAGGVAAAVDLVRGGVAHLHALEVEVDTLEQLDEALACGATMVLLDNMDTPTVRDAVARVAGRAVVEVSGGVRLERVRELAESGVDVISAGALTTRAPWIDLALDLEV
jgi:nicotinate-nucleotide pyrophosphorylase (carboxylating)